MSTFRASLVRSLALVVGIVPAYLLAACDLGEVPIGSDHEHIACDSDSDCPALQVCQNQVCGVCQPGAEACDGVDNDCDGEVDEGDLCAAGEICNLGNCIGVLPPMCSSDAECAAGFTCQNGVCLASQGCMADADCPPNSNCQNGACVPVGCNPAPELCDGLDNDCDGVVDDEASCGAGLQCVAGACVVVDPPACMSDMDCAAGQICVNGVCLFEEPCMSDLDCAMGQICINGTCLIEEPPMCMSDLDCAPGQSCVAGACLVVDPPICMADADCPAGLVCQNGLCLSGNCNPAPEACDGIDNDCDGVIDDGASCGAGLLCVNGGCVAVDPGPCMSNMDCPAGMVCQNGMCTP